MSAFPPAAQLDVPIIDGDGMGRAYPTIAHGEQADISRDPAF